MSFTRRRFVKTIAGASFATVARSSLGACPNRPTVPVAPVPEVWTNWPQSEPPGPGLKYPPASISDLVEIARNATSAARVKASGSRWSSSGAARAEAAWIDTSALRGVISWDLTNLADQYPPDRRGNLILVRAGTKIHALATELWARANPKSIPTLGGSMGQSIAGAISTGTHGSDIELPPIASMVRAIHLVAPGGCEFWLEHPDRPVASRNSLRNYADWHDSITTFRNADAFNAALVSAGRCGLIYSYVLEVERAYQLRADRGRSSWSAVRAHLQKASDSDNWMSFIRGNQLPFNESTNVRSSGTPSAISTGAKLSLIWTGDKNPGQFRWIHVDQTTGGWSRKRIVDDGRVRQSAYRPAIAFFNGRYYVAWTGTNESHPYIHVMRSDFTGEYWADHIRFDGTGGQPEAQSSEGPVLLAANDRLHIVWVGSNKPGRFRWITSTNGLTWGDRRILTDPGQNRESNHRPSIAFFNNRYYLAWTGTNAAHPYVHMIRSNDASGTSWGNHMVFDGGRPGRPEAKSSDGPCLLAANGRVHIVWVGTNRPGEFRWITSAEGSVWGDRRVLRDSQTRKSNYSPDIVFHEGRYYLFWTGYGSDENVHVLRSTTSSGRTWTNHAKLSVPPGPRLDMQGIRSLDVVLSPESANDYAWWTARTIPPTNQTPTKLNPGRSALEQRILVEALAKALDPSAGGPIAVILDTLRKIFVGGVLGGSLFMIAEAIAQGIVANSEDVLVTILDLLFEREVTAPPTTGPSFQITSGNAVGTNGDYEQKYREFWELAPKVQYTEVFFDAQRSDYLRFIDAVLTRFQASSSKQVGYIAIRFTGPSDAPLGMQRWKVTVAVEVVILQALDPASKQTVEMVNSLAVGYDARFHLGMIRPASFRPAGLQSEIDRWKAGARLLGVRANDGFSSAFSRDSGLEP